jgi:hypothetical protein
VHNCARLFVYLPFPACLRVRIDHRNALAQVVSSEAQGIMTAKAPFAYSVSTM